MKENILQTNSTTFAIRIINLRKYLVTNHKEYELSKQVLRSGTAIGAQIMEGEYAQSKADFIHKFHIAIKEANETKYWLSLLSETEYIQNELHESLKTDCEELLKLLTASIKTAKNNLEKSK